MGRERTLTRRAIAIESEESDAEGECDGRTLAIKTKADVRVSTELQPSASKQQPDKPVAQKTRKTKRRHESTPRKKLRISRSPTPILDKPNMDFRSSRKPVTSTPFRLRDGGGGDWLGREKTPVITTKADGVGQDDMELTLLHTEKRAGIALKAPGRKRIATAQAKGGSISGSRVKATATKPLSNHTTAEPTVRLQKEVAPSLEMSPYYEFAPGVGVASGTERAKATLETQPQSSGPADSVGILSNIRVTSTQPPSVEEDPIVILRSSSPMQSGPEVVGKHKNQKNPCHCNVLDKSKDIPLHFRSTAKACLLKGKSSEEQSHLRRLIQEEVTGRRRKTRGFSNDSPVVEGPMVTHSPVIPKPSSNTVADAGDREKKSSIFAIKASFAKMVKNPGLGEIIRDAVDRWNVITQEGLKLLNLLQNRSQNRQMTPRLRIALERYKQARLAELGWTSRSGLTQPLNYAGTAAMADIRRHVVVHLAKRITGYMRLAIATLVEKAPALEGKLAKKDYKKIATHLTAALVYDEKQAYAIAKAKGEDPPPVPEWVQPDSVYSMLRLRPTSEGKAAKEILSLLALHPAISRAIEMVFQTITNWIPQGGLPICKSKAADRLNNMGRDNPWMRYYYGVHYRMLRDIENWNESAREVGELGRPSRQSGKSVSRVYYSWAKRQVDEICSEDPEELLISRRGKRRAALALLAAVHKGKQLKDDIICDGTACSMICNREAVVKQEPPRPTTVLIDEETLFVAIDPGETDVISGYAPKLTFSQDGDGREGRDGVGTSGGTMPIFMPDFDAESIEKEYRDKKQQRCAKSKAGKECTFSLSAKEWRHRAGHSTVDNQRDMRVRRLKEEGVDIAAITSSITTSKTIKLEVYLEHLRTTLHHIRTLREFHSAENGWKFYKYRQTQKTLLEMVKRVKGPGGDELPKSKVVVAFGNAKFSPAGRKGSRRAPVEKFKKFLARHATLVPMDEFGTLR
ncbi:hypothetical protein HK104_010741, partial [Borealophlyctis nickersoniae]